MNRICQRGCQKRLCQLHKNYFFQLCAFTGVFIWILQELFLFSYKQNVGCWASSPRIKNNSKIEPLSTRCHGGPIMWVYALYACHADDIHTLFSVLTQLLETWDLQRAADGRHEFLCCATDHCFDSKGFNYCTMSHPKRPTDQPALIILHWEL